MGLLKSRERSPAEEARRQAEIASEVAHQHDLEMARQRDLTYQNARRREQMWLAQEQAREDRRMAEAARVQAEKRDREKRQRESQVALDQQRAEAYQAAKLEVANIDKALAQLAVPPDLSSPAGALRAADQQARVSALRELREKADARLVVAERAIGRHRT